MPVRTLGALALALAAVLPAPARARPDTRLEPRPWPAERRCESCIPLRFGRLLMQLTPSEIAELLLTEDEEAPAPTVRQGLQFLMLSPGGLLRPYQRDGLLKPLGVHTNRQFLEAIGRPPRAGERALARARQGEGIDNCESYTRSSQGAISAFWIKSPSPGRQRIYFLVDGSPTVYLLAGEVTPAFLDALLSGLRIAELP
ncbi:hypothetical protein [Pelomonas sp. KK5]|uniref:hypothetical protein n=1 Tax=Pelomonas sp. KK5 TaxID=1855730 RepID=UPI00097BE11E|nr:hypothetical protein [Pelomonas sp. KK5]